MSCEVGAAFRLQHCDGKSKKISEIENKVTRSRLMKFSDNIFDVSSTICAKHLTLFSKSPGLTCCNPHKISGHRAQPTAWATGRIYLQGCTGGNKDEFMSLIRQMDGLCKRCTNLKSLMYPSTGNFEETDSVEPTEDESLNKLNGILKIAGMDAIHFGKRNRIGKQRLIQHTINELQQEISSWFEVPTPSKEDETKFQKLVHRINEKLNSANTKESAQLMTLFTGIMTYDKIKDTFGISQRTATNASTLLKHKGILSSPSEQRRRGLPNETLVAVREFFMSEDNTRILPNMKNVVTENADGEIHEIAQRILLMSTVELHASFREKFPSLLISYSKFAELRPECCILLGDAKKEVCVCVYHNNLEMLFESIGIRKYAEYLELLVCCKTSKNCMYRRCLSCQSKTEEFIEAIDKHITEQRLAIKTAGVTFKQWCQTDRPMQVLHQLSFPDFLQYLLSASLKILKHHFVIKMQAQFFSVSKAEVKDDTAVVQCDFSENFTTTYLKETQALHFGKTQSTLHPFMIYTKQNAKIESFSVVVISNNLEHVTNTYFTFQRAMLNWLKRRLPNVKQIKYFTDGAAGHYKNKKNMVNLLNHKRDHGLLASHHFYASCHGKGACDGIGGTAKSKARRASLSGLADTATPFKFYEYVKANLKFDEVIYISNDDIEKTVEEYDLEARYEAAKKIPQIRQVHRVEPGEDGSTLKLYEVSRDTDPFSVIKYKSDTVLFSADDFEKDDYVAAFYDSKWYYGKVVDVIVEDEEVLVHFLEGEGAPSLKFSKFETKPIYVPLSHIITKVKSPRINHRTNVMTFDKAVRILVESKISDSILND